MDEEISIIDAKTRNEKIKNFFITNKKLILSILLLIIIVIFGFYSFQIYQKGQRVLISDKYNSAVIDYENGAKSKTVLLMKEVIEEEDSTYSPLALYFLIDNNLIESREKINELFDVLIKKTSLDKEIKNLIIYKKGLYNADFVNENELLNILKPVINSDSVWKSHALYLLAEFFYSKDQKQKAKDFFSQILQVENANQDIAKETQKRLNRDLSE